MKEGETEKTKRYSALCWTEDVITQDVLDSKLPVDKVPVFSSFGINIQRAYVIMNCSSCVVIVCVSISGIGGV